MGYDFNKTQQLSFHHLLIPHRHSTSSKRSPSPLRPTLLSYMIQWFRPLSYTLSRCRRLNTGQGTRYGTQNQPLKLENKILGCLAALQWQNKQTFGNITRQIHQTHNQLSQCQLDDPSSHSLEQKKQLQNKLNGLLALEETMQRQRSQAI